MTDAPRVTPEQIEAKIVDKTFHRLTDVLTVCVLTLQNGFTVTGESACVSPENYDQEIGERIAYQNAFDKIWPLEGYLLKEETFLCAEANREIDQMLADCPDDLGVYLCHKVVHARPMKRGEYNRYRGWQIPADENPEDEGYLVIYGKDTEDHHESWSPKKQFDEGYGLLFMEEVA